MNRVVRLCTMALLLTLVLLLAPIEAACAQDQRPPDEPDPVASSQVAGMWQVSTTADSYTVWRKDINSDCSFSDHKYTLDIPADPDTMSDISYTMTNYDVDYNDPQGCAGGPEVDHMFFNGHFLGILTGANNSWSVNSWPLDPSQVVSGTNDIYIDTDAPGTGCWCVGVGYIEVRAKLGFEVVKHTPQSDDKNRDFHKDKLDLTVTFSNEYDASTLTDDTFKLEYRAPRLLVLWKWEQVPGSFTQLGPDEFRFVPDADLKDGVRYRATVKGGSSGVKSKEGAVLKGDTVWRFWTVPNLDLTGSFDYGGGSICPPSADPCPGLDLTVFQVARNATMVSGGKPAVARLYMRWKEHTDVFWLDRVKAMDVNASVSVDGTTYGKRETVKRPDRYGKAEIRAANNTVNLYHTPHAGFNYRAEVIPHPQTNATPVKYTQHLNLATSPRSPSIRFDYYVLKDGVWAGGVPANARTDGINLMTSGSQFVTDQFPVLGTTFDQMGDYTIGYTATGTIIDAGCEDVREVECPGSGNQAEWMCVYEKLETMRGGHKFVVATVPDNFCPGATAFAVEEKVVMHQSGTPANDGTIAHELGHIYGISTANNPNQGHRNDSDGVEGFQVRTKTNRSHVENPDKAISLMHTTVQPEGTQWIHNDDYTTLLGTVTVSGLKATTVSAPGSYLIVSGYIDTDAGTVDLTPAFLQEVPNDPPSATGDCTIELLDGANAVLAADHVTPGVDVHIDMQGETSGSASVGSAASVEPQYFTVSLPWDASAQRLRVTCDSAVLLTEERTASAPTVDFDSLTDGDDLSGVRTLSWTGNDPDSSELAYQLQVSEDEGANWTPLTPVGPHTTFDLDTTLLASQDDVQLRVMVTDGFNTAYAVRTVNIVNVLTVVGVLPIDGAGDVDVNTPVQALFVTDVATPTLEGAGFQLLRDSSHPIPGTVAYDAHSRVGVFSPQTPLQDNTSYTARLAASVEDVNGNSLGSTYEWSFTTAADTMPPLVIHTSPADGELDVPPNALVQARFNEAMDASTLTESSFQLLDEDENPVAGAVSYDPASRQALFTPASDLTTDTAYKARLTTDVTDAAGNALEGAYEWHFTTGDAATPNGVRIVGNYNDQANDVDGDGLYDNLTIYVDVEVLSADTYNLNGRLEDKFGELLAWQTTGNVYLIPGIHTLQLVFDSVPIRSNGVDGPYVLDALNFYHVGDPSLSAIRLNPYQTFPYEVTGFYSVMTLGGLPDQLLEWNTTRDNAFNLKDYTTHDTQPLEDVTYSILINTDPTVGVSIDDDDNVDINPPPDTEAESDVTIEARDSLGNRVLSTFHISVQAPRDSSLVAFAEPTMGMHGSQDIEVEIYDQWGRLFTGTATVAFETTLGTVAPVTVTTTSGTASTTLSSGGATGTAFVTIATENASTIVAVDVVQMTPIGGLTQPLSVPQLVPWISLAALAGLCRLLASRIAALRKRKG